MSKLINQEIIHKFYQAFMEKNADEMVKYYHENIEFEDPAFGKLKGHKAMNMWRMLCDSQKENDFQVSFDIIHCDDLLCQAKWEAKYMFSKTGRKVHNKISANFTFKNGLIISHKDDFNLRQWAKQAMGIKGALLGGTSFFKKKLQQQTNLMLSKFEEKNS